jgi:hypothetical protein
MTCHGATYWFFSYPVSPARAASERKAFAFRPVECRACGSGARYWLAKIGMEDDTDLERKQRSSFRATPTKAGGDPESSISKEFLLPALVPMMYSRKSRLLTYPQKVALWNKGANLLYCQRYGRDPEQAEYPKMISTAGSSK